MDFHGWTHPFDGKGRRRAYADLPKTVAAMEDDPYRSLAGELRYIGGFAKDFDAVLGIRLGRLPAPPHQAEGCAQELRGGDREGAHARQIGGGELPAGLVRAARRQGGDREGQSQRRSRRRAKRLNGRRRGQVRFESSPDVGRLT